jgi:hypothetical protein
MVGSDLQFGQGNGTASRSKANAEVRDRWIVLLLEGSEVLVIAAQRGGIDPFDQVAIRSLTVQRCKERAWSGQRHLPTLLSG